MSIQRFLQLLTGISLLSMAAVSAVTYLNVKRFLTPLSRIVETAEALNRGDLTVDIEVRGHDEVGQALLAMKTMVTRTGETLNMIVMAVKKTADPIADIASASQQQALGIEQVGKAVAQMDTVTQQTAGHAEEVSGTAQRLAAQAEMLSRLAGQRLDVAYALYAGQPGRGLGADAWDDTAAEDDVHHRMLRPALLQSSHLRSKE